MHIHFVLLGDLAEELAPFTSIDSVLNHPRGARQLIGSIFVVEVDEPAVVAIQHFRDSVHKDLKVGRNLDN
jgi:hypothetical protein